MKLLYQVMDYNHKKYYKDCEIEGAKITNLIKRYVFNIRKAYLKSTKFSYVWNMRNLFTWNRKLASTWHLFTHTGIAAGECLFAHMWCAAYQEAMKFLFQFAIYAARLISFKLREICLHLHDRLFIYRLCYYYLLLYRYYL